MKIEVQGKKMDVLRGQKLLLHDGKTVEALGELDNGLVVKDVENGQTTVIDPMRDILEVILEAVKKTVLEMIIGFLKKLF